MPMYWSGFPRELESIECVYKYKENYFKELTHVYRCWQVQNYRVG